MEADSDEQSTQPLNADPPKAWATDMDDGQYWQNVDDFEIWSEPSSQLVLLPPSDEDADDFDNFPATQPLRPEDYPVEYGGSSGGDRGDSDADVIVRTLQRKRRRGEGGEAWEDGEGGEGGAENPSKRIRRTQGDGSTDDSTPAGAREGMPEDWVMQGEIEPVGFLPLHEVINQMHTMQHVERRTVTLVEAYFTPDDITLRRERAVARNVLATLRQHAEDRTVSLPPLRRTIAALRNVLGSRPISKRVEYTRLEDLEVSDSQDADEDEDSMDASDGHGDESDHMGESDSYDEGEEEEDDDMDEDSREEPAVQRLVRTVVYPTVNNAVGDPGYLPVVGIPIVVRLGAHQRFVAEESSAQLTPDRLYQLRIHGTAQWHVQRRRVYEYARENGITITRPGRTATMQTSERKMIERIVGTYAPDDHDAGHMRDILVRLFTPYEVPFMYTCYSEEALDEQTRLIWDAPLTAHALAYLEAVLMAITFRRPLALAMLLRLHPFPLTMGKNLFLHYAVATTQHWAVRLLLSCLDIVAYEVTYGYPCFPYPIVRSTVATEHMAAARHLATPPQSVIANALLPTGYFKADDFDIYPADSAQMPPDVLTVEIGARDVVRVTAKRLRVAGQMPTEFQALRDYYLGSYESWKWLH